MKGGKTSVGENEVKMMATINKVKLNLEYGDIKNQIPTPIIGMINVGDSAL